MVPPSTECVEMHGVAQLLAVRQDVNRIAIEDRADFPGESPDLDLLAGVGGLHLMNKEEPFHGSEILCVTVDIT